MVYVIRDATPLIKTMVYATAEAKNLIKTMVYATDQGPGNATGSPGTKKA